MWDCINPKHGLVLGIPSVINTDDLVDSDSSELRSKLTGIQTKRLLFQLVVDQCSTRD